MSEQAQIQSIIQPLAQILWIEDDPYSVEHHYKVLTEEYAITLGALRDIIETNREENYDLLILDLMIHPQSYTFSKTTDESIQFEGTQWRRTGVEFLRRLRGGIYTDYGLPAPIPVIIASAVSNFDVRETIINEYLVPKHFYLEKPFRVDILEDAIQKALSAEVDHD